MAIVQSFLPYTNATVSQYTTWGQGIGSALSTLGWTKVADAGGVTWANIVSTANIPQSLTPAASAVLFSAWSSAGVAYTPGTQNTSSQTTFSVVTNTGLTWACINATQTPGNTGGLPPLTGGTANQNSSNTLSITSVNTTSGGNTIYNGSGFNATSNFYWGMLFIVTGSTIPANNGVFVCQASTSTTLTLSNAQGVAAAAQTITAVSSSANISFFSVSNTGVWNNNGVAGQPYTIAGFTGGAAVNNGTFTVLASHNISNGNGVIVVANTGSSVTVSGTTFTDIAPPSGSNQVANITATSITSNVLTVTAINSFTTGQVVVLSATEESFLNGQTVTVLAGATSTQFTANFTHANFSNATDTGTAGLVGDTIHWMPYNYEIWKTNGPLSSTAPIYLKLVYASFSGSTGTNSPAVLMDIGTQNPSTGLVSGNHLGEFYTGFNSTTGVGNTFECDFSGDADNFAWILWRNGASVSANIPQVLFIDRTRDQNGVGLSTFFNVGINSSINPHFFWTVFNSSVGGVIQFTGQWPIIFVTNNGLAYQGLTPVLPIFPMPGYIANPCFMAVSMQVNDFSDGQLVNAVIYGGSHTFLMSKSIAINNTGIGSFTYPGIRWE